MTPVEVTPKHFTAKIGIGYNSLTELQPIRVAPTERPAPGVPVRGTELIAIWSANYIQSLTLSGVKCGCIFLIVPSPLMMHHTYCF